MLYSYNDKNATKKERLSIVQQPENLFPKNSETCNEQQCAQNAKQHILQPERSVHHSRSFPSAFTSPSTKKNSTNEKKINKKVK